VRNANSPSAAIASRLAHVLGGAHAASGAVNDDADLSFAHSYPPVDCEWSIGAVVGLPEKR